MRGLCLGDSPVKDQQQHPVAAPIAAATAAEGAGLLPTGGGVAASRAGNSGGAAWASEAAGAIATEAAAAAAAWLEKENILKGFDSPLPPADANEAADEADRWGDRHWEETPDEYQQQQQHQQHQQQQQHNVLGEPYGQGFAEQQRVVATGDFPGPPGGLQGLYRKKDGVTIPLWPSAASVSPSACPYAAVAVAARSTSVIHLLLVIVAALAAAAAGASLQLYELVERHYTPGAAGFTSHPYNTPPPPLAAPPPVALSDLLSGHSRRTAARAFRDALSLHSHGLCTLKQEMPEVPEAPVGGPPDHQPGSAERDGQAYPPLLILSQVGVGRKDMRGRMKGLRSQMRCKASL